MTKKQELAEGSQGCISKAGEDEMLFTLRAQDYSSPLVVLEWIRLNINGAASDDKLREAFECALIMRNFKGRKKAD